MLNLNRFGLVYYTITLNITNLVGVGHEGTCHTKEQWGIMQVCRFGINC